MSAILDRCVQELGGHIFMMDGAGADGSATPQYAAYGELFCLLFCLMLFLLCLLRAAHPDVPKPTCMCACASYTHPPANPAHFWPPR